MRFKNYEVRHQLKILISKVIEILDLPNKIVNLEDESDMGTKLNYRLRWCRTNLKSAGKIKNIIKVNGN